MLSVKKKKNYERYDPLYFWDGEKRAFILIQRTRFNNER